MLSKTVMLMSAGALAISVMAAPANARSFTTSAEGAMTEQQKLGPNAVTTQLRNGFVTERSGSRAMSGPVYGYEPNVGYPAAGYGWDSSPRYGWNSGYAYNSGYGYGHRHHDRYGYAPGFGVSIGVY